MLRNYLKVALRNIRKNKLYASLNITGLAIGLGSFFIIYLFLRNELSYDQFHEKGERIYRVVLSLENETGTEKNGGLTYALAPVAAEKIPEIESFSRVETRPKRILVRGIQDSIDQVGSIAVDTGFLDFFDLNFVSGDKASALSSPNSILISESKAMRYYGIIDVLGKVIKVGKVDLSVTGVFQDLPNTSSIKGDVIVPTATINAYRGAGQWNSSFGTQTYFLLRQQIRITEVEDKLNEIFKENAISDGRELSLQALADVHFSLDVSGPVYEKTDRQYIFIFTLVAVFILVCAVFNYVSLALSQSIERTKEIGVRKVTGATNRELYAQFILESVIHVFLSFVLAIILVEFLLPQLEKLIERELDISVLKQPFLMLKAFLFSIAVAFLSSLYPAYLSTQLRVIQIFKKGKGSFSARRLIGVVSVLQIMVFVVLICVSVTANRQMQFMRNENLGFDKEHQMILRNIPYQKGAALKNALLGIPGVESVSNTSSVPNRVMGWGKFSDYDFRFHYFDIDEDYIKTLGMTLLEGRNFKTEDSDSANVIMLNATGASKLGFNRGAVGKTVKINNRDKRIVGVVNDFHFASKKERVEAALFQPAREYQLFVVKLSSKKMTSTIGEIKKVYKQLAEGKEAAFSFLEDQIDAQYRQEKVMITMINTFVLLAAIVSFIGLFGIAGYSIKRRMKEIGIRKVLGANFMTIQTTLTRASVMRLVLAILISVPLIVYWMEGWLSSFAYRIALPTGLIVAALIIASTVILLTALFHSIKVYLINPVEILKDE